MKQALWILLILMVFADDMRSQDLRFHQWKDRIIVVGAKSFNQVKLTEQLDKLEERSEELKERKLVLYEVTPNGVRYHHNNQTQLVSDNGQLFNSMFGKDVEFEIILIGLDGGIKLRSTDPVSREEIFSLIDTMPMRRAELRSKQSHL